MTDSTEVPAATGAKLVQLFDLLQANDAGLGAEYKDGEWMLSVMGGREAPDSPMAGFHAIALEMDLEDALDDLLRQLGVRRFEAA